MLEQTTAELQLGKAVRIVMQTTPYIIYRALVYGAICVAAVVYLGILGLIGLVFGQAAFFGLLAVSVVLGAVTNLGRLLGHYVLYVLRAGHVALITEIATKGGLPMGVSQTEWAKVRVMEYFREISALAFIDQALTVIIRTVNRRLVNAMSAIPISGLESAAKVGQRIADFSLKYVDEAIIAYTFKTESKNVYEAARKGVILYCQAWKGILRNAVMLTLLSYVFVIAASVVFMIPLGGLALFVEDQGIRFALFAIAIFLGVGLKWILFDPVACASTILAFLHESKGREPDPEWEEKLASVSSRFRKLRDKAAEEMGGAGAAT